MQKHLEFNNLESLTRFVHKVRLEPSGAILFYTHYYLLAGKADLTINNVVYPIKFCGTNHTITENDATHIENFLSDAGKGDVLLTEGSQVDIENNNMVDDLSRRVESDPDLAKSINMDAIANRYGGELGYAAKLALQRGVKVINMEMELDPKAIWYMVGLYGKVMVIRKLKTLFDDYFIDKDGLNRYVFELLGKNDVRTNLLEVRAHSRLSSLNDKVEPDGWPYVDRDHYMAQNVLKELSHDRPVYAIAHTVHIEGIINILAQNGGITSFSAQLSLNDKRCSQESRLNALHLAVYGPRHKRLLLFANKLANRFSFMLKPPY